MKVVHMHIAIPLLDEGEHLPALLEDIRRQQGESFTVYFCVNQPDVWWQDPEKKPVCERNMRSMEYLEKECDFPCRLIDRSSPGKGWKGKEFGVGWARKVIMDEAIYRADSGDIIITLDGDTSFKEGYFRSVAENFKQHPEAVGLSVPYYHKRCCREAEDRAILRYEIYMRHYAINLWRIGNPYRFTALGSAMAVPVSAYRAMGGMSPKKSGEDFYFLQKLVKYGKLLTWNTHKVYPAARFSDRVFFGTGPAMIKGASGDWDSYPVYHPSLFDLVAETYGLFPDLFEQDTQTPMDDFLTGVLNMQKIWQPLRENARSRERFARACRDRIDGLRILQFLKFEQKQAGYRDEDGLLEYFGRYHPGIMEEAWFPNKGFTFDELGVEILDRIRNALAGIEENYQRSAHGK